MDFKLFCSFTVAGLVPGFPAEATINTKKWQFVTQAGCAHLCSPQHPCMHCTREPSQVPLFISRGSSHTVCCAEVGFNWHYYSTNHFSITIPIYISLGERSLSLLYDMYSVVHDFTVEEAHHTFQRVFLCISKE